MNYNDAYNFWLNNPKIDEESKNLLLKMDEIEKKESFYKNLEFGTGGLRGIMGLGTNRINIYTIRKVTKGFANYLIEKKLNDKGVAISYDNRLNSRKFAFEAARVLATFNIKTYVFKNLTPTPMLSFAVRHFNAGGGIMITASHNPKEYNGYKVYNETGAQLNLEQSNLAIAHIEKIEDVFDIKVADNDNLITIIDESFDEIYFKMVDTIKINETKKLAKIVYSPLHGTGSRVIPKYLKSRGYDFNPYMPQMLVDSSFPNTKSSNPEDPLAYIESLKYAEKINADAIFLTDPDADRIGIAIKHQEKYHLVGGNQTNCLMAYYILSQKKKLNLLPKNGSIYTTIVSSDLMIDIANSFNVKAFQTLTGFKFIADELSKNEDKYEYLFGSEESFGNFVNSFVRDKDGIQAVFLLSEIVSYLKEKNMSVFDYLEEIYQQYGYYYEFTKNLILTGLDGSERIKKITSYFRKNSLKLKDYKFLGHDDISCDIRYQNKKDNLSKSNVLKFYYDNNLWVILRPSGTEPKLKIYYSIKDNNMDDAKNKIEKINLEVLNIIDKI